MKHEARIISHLENSGPLTAVEISQATGTPLNYARAILYNLKRDGLLIIKPRGFGKGRPLLWSLKRGDV